MSHRIIITLLGVALIILGAVEREWFLIAVWLGFDFLILGIAHGRGSHRVFGKRADGTLPFWGWIAFFPLLMFTTVVWHLVRLLSSESAYNVVNEQLVVGRRLLSFEIEGEFDNFVDLTAEFAEPSNVRRLPSYRCFPILDGLAPTPEELHVAVNNLLPGRTYVHCAQGHGRTGLFALAILLDTGVVCSVEEGLRILSTVRPGIRLSRVQLNCIELYAKSRG